MSSPLHGGDVAGIARAAGRRPSEYLDFSANINPLGPPARVRTALRDFAASETIAQYPEPELPELRTALARACGIAPGAVAIGAGSAALFDAIVRASTARRWALPIPAFAEYRRALANAACEIVPYALNERAGFALDPHDLARFVEANACSGVILTNPHNPSGSLVPAEVLRAALDRLPHVCAVVDEAFIDFAHAQTLSRDAAHRRGLVVVRSLTKFFAMPSMRVGYAIALPQTIAAIAAFIPAWPVSTIAASVAARALADEGYARETLELIERERAVLAASLRDLGLATLPAAANFLCFQLPAGMTAAKVRADLLERYCIVIRDCTSFEGMPSDRWVRIAVRDAAANARLIAAFAAVLA